jgi:hypothetical protein
MAEIFKSIEDIDKALEKKYEDVLKVAEEVDTEEVAEEVIEDAVVEEENPDVAEDIDEDEDIDDEEEVSAEETDEDEDEFTIEPKVDKKDYAFKKLRDEKAALKAKDDAYEDMAVRLGYKDGKALLKAYKEKQIADEAKSKGVDPEFYKEFSDMKDELAQTKRAKTEQERQGKVDKFIRALDEVAETNSLTALEKQAIIDQLGEDGYTMDDIVNVKTPKRLIRGYLVDKIVESKVQKNLKTKKTKQSLQEDKISSAVVKKDDWKDEIRKELEAYAKENNLYFED